MASIFRHAAIHVLATLVVVAAVRPSMPDPVCEDVEAATKSVRTRGQCVCKSYGAFATGKGCGNALLKDKFSLGEIVDVNECACKKPLSCTDFGGESVKEIVYGISEDQRYECKCAAGRELLGEGCPRVDDSARFAFGYFSLNPAAGPDCNCAFSPRWQKFETACHDVGGVATAIRGGSCNCMGDEVFLGDHCPIHFEKRVEINSKLGMDFPRFANDCACKLSRGFLEASKVTAVNFCQKVGDAAMGHRFNYHPFAVIPKWSGWMKETWATEICSAVVSESEDPSEGINQLQTNQRPDEKMEVRRKSRAWYLLEGDQSRHRSLKVALKKVCHDECANLVKKLQDEETLKAILPDVEPQDSLAERCANLVVRQVEAETLGCCARSCGWNGATCRLWDFMNDEAKQGWKLECCAEGAILKGSSRQKMCNSVLPKKRQRIMAEHDEPYRTKGLSSFVGQDFDGVDSPSSSASMLETEEVECRINSKCAPHLQIKMWAACAREYKWQFLDMDVAHETCKAEQFKTSRENFAECSEPGHGDLRNMKWRSDGGRASCTRFDDACERRFMSSVVEPDDWQERQEGWEEVPSVVHFIKVAPK